MKCAWEAYLKLVPPWLKNRVDNIGKEKLQELRLRVGRPPELVLRDGSQYLDAAVTEADLNYCINAASQYSPWSSATSTSGFITATGGHRVGLCGNAVIIDGQIRTLTHLSSLNIRVARDFPGIGSGIENLIGSILIIGSPGRGKTTLLRDLIRQKSNINHCNIAVVDERRELFPYCDGGFCFEPGIHTDVISGCSKAEGIDMLIRTMKPDWLAVDEITAEADCRALLHAGWCGVSLIATLHAADIKDFQQRPVYQMLVQSNLFTHIITMQPNKSWVMERMNICT